MSVDVRFVFDTNTLIAAACFPRSFGLRAFNHVLDHGTFITCSQALDELLDVIVRSKFDRFSPRADRIKFYEIYLVEAESIQIAGTLKVCRDPTDDKFLELAVTGKAEYLVTRDNDLLVMNPFRGVHICDAEYLVSLLGATPSGATR